MLPHHILLLGPMGTGKTTVGAKLASKLGCPFYDTDRLIEQRLGLTVAQIFARSGETVFREAEHNVVLQAIGQPEGVIALGGGVVSETNNLEFLFDVPLRIYLKTSVQQQYLRTLACSRRPLLAKAVNRYSLLAKLMEAREPWYKHVASTTICTDELGPEQVVDKVLQRTKLHHARA